MYDLLPSENVAIESPRTIKIFHVKNNMPELFHFHGYLSPHTAHSFRKSIPGMNCARSVFRQPHVIGPNHDSLVLLRVANRLPAPGSIALPPWEFLASLMTVTLLSRRPSLRVSQSSSSTQHDI